MIILKKGIQNSFSTTLQEEENIDVENDGILFELLNENRNTTSTFAPILTTTTKRKEVWNLASQEIETLICGQYEYKITDVNQKILEIGILMIIDERINASTNIF